MFLPRHNEKPDPGLRRRVSLGVGQGECPLAFSYLVCHSISSPPIACMWGGTVVNHLSRACSTAYIPWKRYQNQSRMVCYNILGDKTLSTASLTSISRNAAHNIEDSIVETDIWLHLYSCSSLPSLLAVLKTYAYHFFVTALCGSVCHRQKELSFYDLH